jgi:hypothetical protein
VLLGHLVNRSVRSLNRDLHQVLVVGAVHLMTESLVENFNRSL